MTSARRHTPTDAAERAQADPLHGIGALLRDIAVAPDLAQALDRAVAGIADVLQAEAGALFLTDDSGGFFYRSLAGSAKGYEVPTPLADAVDTQGRHPAGPRLQAPISANGRRLGVVEIWRGRGGRSFDAGDVALLQGLAAATGLAVANTRLAQELEEQDGLRRELELAAEIQRHLLPRPREGGFPVLGLNRPARSVSGDFFDFFTRGDGAIPFALGDVSGKGVNAALLMAKTASLFRCLAKTIDDPAALLGVINRELYETSSRGMFVTMVAGVYDQAAGRLRFANAGHEPPLLRLPDRSYLTFPAEAPPLGILPDLAFGSHERDLDGGEFYVFSDGLTEFAYGESERLGVEGLIHLLEAWSDRPLGERLRCLLAELDLAGWEARDDLTLLAIDAAWVPNHA